MARAFARRDARQALRRSDSQNPVHTCLLAISRVTIMVARIIVTAVPRPEEGMVVQGKQ